MFGHRFFGARFFGPRYWGDGASVVSHATSGVLAGAGAVIVGVAAHVAIHGTSGVLTGAGASVVGTAAHVAVHGTSGVLTGAGSVIAGAAARSGGATTHDTSGALAGPGASLAGYAQRGLVRAISNRGRAILATKQLAETRRITFDFISQLAAGETLVSATNTISVYSGADPLNLLALVGSPALSSSRVTQTITSGVRGCTYQIICRGLTNTGKQTFLNAFFLVL